MQRFGATRRPRRRRPDRCARQARAKTHVQTDTGSVNTSPAMTANVPPCHSSESMLGEEVAGLAVEGEHDNRPLRWRLPLLRTACLVELWRSYRSVSSTRSATRSAMASDAVQSRRVDARGLHQARLPPVRAGSGSPRTSVRPGRRAPGCRCPRGGSWFSARSGSSRRAAAWNAASGSAVRIRSRPCAPGSGRWSQRHAAPGGPGQVHADAVAARVGQRIDRAVHQMPRRRRQLGVVAPDRVDREGLAAERGGDLVGVEARCVDHGAARIVSRAVRIARPPGRPAPPSTPVPGQQRHLARRDPPAPGRARRTRPPRFPSTATRRPRPPRRAARAGGRAAARAVAGSVALRRALPPFLATRGSGAVHRCPRRPGRRARQRGQRAPRDWASA